MISELLLKRGLRVDRLSCGVRAKYIAGCRCDDCRKSNTLYERLRAAARRNGDYNAMVPAARARTHILKLRRQGVGLRAIAAATNINRSVLQGIVSRRRGHCWTRNERKILACTPAIAGDHALISARATWRRIEQLIEEGFTKRQLARRLGKQSDALQLGRERITVKNAAKVERLHRSFSE
jgi:hypothetical protein